LALLTPLHVELSDDDKEFIILKEEFEKAFNEMKNKAVGVDTIPIELIK